MRFLDVAPHDLLNLYAYDTCKHVIVVTYQSVSKYACIYAVNNSHWEIPGVSPQLCLNIWSCKDKLSIISNISMKYDRFDRCDIKKQQ